MTMQPFDELADEDLDRIEARVMAATSGPWFSYVAGRDPEADNSFIELGRCNELGTFESIELVGATAADQDFIASARQDVPRLLQTVRGLRARLQLLSRDVEAVEPRTIAVAAGRPALPLLRSM